MLLVATIGLLIVALGLLVFGFEQDSLPYVYASIACSVMAAVGLTMFTRITRRRAQRRVGARQNADAAPAAVATAGERGRREDNWREDHWPEDGPGEEEDRAQEEGAREEEAFFPIAGYGRLRVPEILPLLGDLDADELEAVRARELAGKARKPLIHRLDLLLALFADIPDSETAAVAETTEAPVGPAAVAPVRETAVRSDGLPIQHYDRLRPSEIVPRLSLLTPEELAAVAAHEEQHLRRRTILVRINRLQGRGPRFSEPPSW